MIRQVIKIDEDKCTGCGICADACQEGAIGIVDGKAKLLRDDYCDGLGNCLPTCPTNAISFETREAAAFDEDAVKQNMQKAKEQEKPAFVCPGSMAKAIKHNTETSTPVSTSQLSQWPVQIKLVPVNAPYFDNANLLIAADCSAYAYGNFHNKFIKNRITLIGCPKLDDNGVIWQTSELGKVDQGGGGTIAQYVANLNMDVIDCGVPVLSMHAPFEVTAKSDVYMAYKSYVAFYNNR